MPNYAARQEKLKSLMQRHSLPTLVLNPSQTLKYLTGLSFHLMERPVIVLFSLAQPPVFLIPELEKTKLDGLSYPYQVHTYSDDVATWPATFQKLTPLVPPNSTLAIEELHLRYFEYQYLQAALPSIRFVPAAPVVESLRLSKDESELQAIRQAVAIAQIGLQNTLSFIKPGVSERAIAAELTLQMLKAGCDPSLPFEPIVAGGPNSANPHAMPSDRLLQPGDLLVIDWGAGYQGYISDLTRTLAIGKIEPRLKQIYDVVFEANQRGRQTARPGLTCGNLDAAVRQVITEASYGDYFTHRTGHGIGLEAHEPPYIRADNPAVLASGQTFTIEPGIYLPGVGGVRIEDDAAITPDGVEILTDFDRRLIVI